MTNFDLNTAKYDGAESRTFAEQWLMHDACNLAMAILVSETGCIKFLGRFTPSTN